MVPSPRTTITGPPSFNAGGDADLLSVACPSAGNCSAGGYYWDWVKLRLPSKPPKRGFLWHRQHLMI